MKISAIIAEYNPLHNGHLKLIRYAKSISDAVVCIMSGNFTQRGLPACSDKYARARHAIKGGADIVIELPFVYATSSAENFALGAIKMVDAIKCDYLVFGSESGDADILKNCALRLMQTDPNPLIKRFLSEGKSYPRAVAEAAGKEFSEILAKPNNTLAVEYLKALEIIGSSVVPITVKREDNYNLDAAGEEFASAGALRADKSLRTERYLPAYSLHDINDDVEQNFKRFAVSYLSMCEARCLSQIEGVTEGLENRLLSADKTRGYDAYAEELKTKRYTRTKLQRVILHSTVGMTKETAAYAKSSQPFFNVLAVSKEKTDLLSVLPKSGKDSVIKHINDRADNLYSSLSGAVYPRKLQKIDR